MSENSYQVNQLVAELAKRSVFEGAQPGAVGMKQADQVKAALAGCFAAHDDEDLQLKDEFSAKTIEFVVSECRQILGDSGGNSWCWQKMSEFLASELWEFGRLKEDLSEAEKQVGMVRGKLEEASVPVQGEINQKRVMACAMLLAEKEMRRDQLQNRVSMIVDQFVWRILAGTQHEPGGEVLELRLRGVFGAL